uniref:MARVEL domain-containing protein n=1 Tax=Timema genevievae TaxID=629358 RepID=A0A7R9JYK5_TIMGE|nr:unnamed protein product [Timema genevievae]
MVLYREIGVLITGGSQTTTSEPVVVVVVVFQILGAVCVGLSAYYLRSYYYQNQVPVLFFLLMATAFLITTFCLMFSSLISISTASFLPKTIFEVIYHIVAFSLYLAASINLMVDISKYSKNSTYDAFLAASLANAPVVLSQTTEDGEIEVRISIIGLINSVLYLCSAVLAIRSYRGLSI